MRVRSWREIEARVKARDDHVRSSRRKVGCMWRAERGRFARRREDRSERAENRWKSGSTEFSGSDSCLWSPFQSFHRPLTSHLRTRWRAVTDRNYCQCVRIREFLLKKPLDIDFVIFVRSIHFFQIDIKSVEFCRIFESNSREFHFGYIDILLNVVTSSNCWKQLSGDCTTIKMTEFYFFRRDIGFEMFWITGGKFFARFSACNENCLLLPFTLW